MLNYKDEMRGIDVNFKAQEGPDGSNSPVLPGIRQLNYRIESTEAETHLLHLVKTISLNIGHKEIPQADDHMTSQRRAIQGFTMLSW